MNFQPPEEDDPRDDDQRQQAATKPGEADLTAIRAKFEEWIRSDSGDLRTFGSGANMHYSNSAVNNAWTGYLRAALGTAPATPVPAPCECIPCGINRRWPGVHDTPDGMLPCVATPVQPVPASEPVPLDLCMTATGRKAIDAAAEAMSEVMAFVCLGDRELKVARALSGLRAMQALTIQSALSTPTSPAPAPATQDKDSTS
jgi:hypothetical protein